MGNDGHDAEGRCRKIREKYIVGQPQELGDQKDDFQFGFAFDIHTPGERRGSHDGHPADPTGALTAHGKQKLQQGKEDLQTGGVGKLQKNKVPKHDDHIADKSADAAQEDVANTH